MMQTIDLINYLNEILKCSSIQDYCSNGLQVEGKRRTHKIVTAVTASLNIIEQAIALNADTLLVHHGYFWKGENPCVTSVKRRRLALLLEHDINLLAYHLPLDLHPQYGNNVQLAKVLGFDVHGYIAAGGQDNMIAYTELTTPLSQCALETKLYNKLKRPPLVIRSEKTSFQKIAWCTGAAQDFIEVAALRGMEAFISGEISERTVHLARELGITYLAAGHHATERYGVQVLGSHLNEKFGLEVMFVDEDNPV